MSRWSHGDANLRFSVVSFIYLDSRSPLAIITKPLTIKLRPFLSRVHLQAQTWHLFPPSIPFNPNLSHSTLNKDAATWSFFLRSLRPLCTSKSETESRTDVTASRSPPLWRAHPLLLLPRVLQCHRFPSFPLTVRLNSAHDAILCLCIFPCQIWCLPRYDTLAATCFPGLIVHNLRGDGVQLWLLHLCEMKGYF